MVRAERLGPDRPPRSVAVTEPDPRAGQRQHPGLVESAGQVTGVEQGDPQARLGGRLDQGAPHRVRVGVGRPVRLVVHVVELAHAGDPGQHHLGVHGAGQGEVAVRVEPAATSYIRSRQVQNVPRSAWVVPRRARWKACEWALARPGRVRPRRCSASSAAGAAGVTEVKRSPSASMRTSRRRPGRGARPGRRATVAWSPGHVLEDQGERVHAASQSAAPACSAGECETPVGLRTNSMAVGIRAARIPASCPAPGGEHGSGDAGRGEHAGDPVPQALVESHQWSVPTPDGR